MKQSDRTRRGDRAEAELWLVVRLMNLEGDLTRLHTYNLQFTIFEVNNPPRPRLDHHPRALHVRLCDETKEFMVDN